MYQKILIPTKLIRAGSDVCANNFDKKAQLLLIPLQIITHTLFFLIRSTPTHTHRMILRMSPIMTGSWMALWVRSERSESHTLTVE